jgi:hypothetical protein
MDADYAKWDKNFKALTLALGPIIKDYYTKLHQSEFHEKMKELINSDKNPNPHGQPNDKMRVVLGKSNSVDLIVPFGTPVWALFDEECHCCGGFYPSDCECKCGK